MHINNLEIKHKIEDHGKNIYCKPIYGLIKKRLLKEFTKIKKSQSDRCPFLPSSPRERLTTDQISSCLNCNTWAI